MRALLLKSAMLVGLGVYGAFWRLPKLAVAYMVIWPAFECVERRPIQYSVGQGRQSVAIIPCKPLGGSKNPNDRVDRDCSKRRWMSWFM